MKSYARVLLLGLVFVVGCGYGKVSPTAYEYAKGLYNITNRKAGDHLRDVREQIAASQESGDLSHKEAGWLIDVVRQAEQEHWQAAMKSARRIMEDQVER